MPPARPEPPSVRYIAYVIWGSLLLGVLVMAGVAAFVGPGFREAQDIPYPSELAVAAAGINVVLLAGARFFPLALPKTMPALMKNIISTAIGEAGALFAAVAWMLTGNRHSVAALILGLSGIAICYPNDSRWRVLGGTVASDLPARDRPVDPGLNGRSDR